MIKQLALAVVLGAGCYSLSPAQSYYDDDIYYNESKVKKEKEDAAKKAAQAKAAANYVPNKSVDFPGADTYTFTKQGVLRDVDEYNRRVKTVASSSLSGPNSDDDSFSYTRRIEKFHNPDIVDGSNDETLQYLYYTSEAEREQKEDITQVNIYLNSPWGWNTTWPYYSGFAWGSPWAWNSWYWNSWYGPSWSYSWNFGPSWSWGWRPSWSWRPSWGYPAPLPPARPGGVPGIVRPRPGGVQPSVSNRRPLQNVSGSVPRISANNSRRGTILRSTTQNSQVNKGNSSNRRGTPVTTAPGSNRTNSSSTLRPSTNSNNRTGTSSSRYNSGSTTRNSSPSYGSGSNSRGGGSTGTGRSGGGGGGGRGGRH